MRMRYEEVEYKICSNLKCLQENLEELKNQREQMKITTPPYIRDIETKYEGDQCPHCHTPFDLACMRTVTFPRLILVDVDPPYYVPVYRVRCPHKQEHYQRVYLGNPFPNIPPSRNL